MRKLLYVVGLVVFVVGLFATLSSALLLIRGDHVGAGLIFWVSVLAIVVGGATLAAVKKRTCRNCLHRIKAEEILCPYCGNVVV